MKCSTLYNTKVQRDNNTIAPVRSRIVKQFFRGVGNQFIRAECEKHQLVEREDSSRYFTVDAIPVTEISFAGAQVDAEVLQELLLFLEVTDVVSHILRTNWLPTRKYCCTQ